MTTKPVNIDQYIAEFSKDVQKNLGQIRAVIKKTAPAAEETIKYGMPTFTLFGNLVYFAAFKNHIGFYPAPTQDPAFKKELSDYKTGRGSIQFLLDKPMPLALVTKMVKYYAKRNAAKAGKKK